MKYMMNEQEFKRDTIGSVVVTWLATFAAMLVAYHSGFIPAVIFHFIIMFGIGYNFTGYKTAMARYVIEINLWMGLMIEALTLLPYWMISYHTPEATLITLIALFPTRVIITKLFLSFNPHVPLRPTYEDYVKGFEYKEQVNRLNRY